MKKIAIRFLVGIPLGIVTSYMMMVIYSLCYGNGSFIAVIRALEQLCESEVKALLIQIIISGMLGSFSVSVVTLFEQESWSVSKACLLHASATVFVLSSSAIVTLYIHSLWLMLFVFLILFLICAVIYIQLYHYTRKQVQDLNSMLSLQKGCE